MRRLNAVLYVVALVLACGCVIGGVMVWRADDTQAQALDTQSRYGAVQASATREAEALLNISYQDAQASIDKVAAGATGKFKKQYARSTDGTIQLLTENKSVMTGKVIWAGVSSIDADSASVIAATTGTVANKQTKNKPVARNFRLKLDLVYVDGTWLTDNLEFLS
ncbi:hypothetical protein [Nocardioides sp.]|uniref:hypothetical protein n=1 Tax=Nocardioides sp. TaxID=35761 RepID=UPI0031FE5AE8|nr:hypothetical protein [Nocardioides sp.]